MRELAGFAEICSMEIYVAFRRRDARATVFKFNQNFYGARQGNQDFAGFYKK